MIWLKLKRWFLIRFAKQSPEVEVPTVEEQLSPELLHEVTELAEKLGTQRVSVQEVAADDEIPDQPEIDDKPFT